MAHDDASDHALVPAGLYVAVWLALLALTGITVGVSYVRMGHIAIATALGIALMKTALVLLYFMHLRFERRLYTFMVLTVIGAYLIFIGFTFTDYGYR